MISEKGFINKYHRQKETFTEFLKSYKVHMRGQISSLSSYAKRKNISTQQLKQLHESINDDYLISFYNTSMKPHSLKIEPSPMKNKAYNNNSNVQYKNIIRNMHFEQLVYKTQPGLPNIRNYGSMLTDIYRNKVIDYKILTPSALHYIEMGRIGSVYSSYYFRASILNPYLVYSLNETLLKGSKIFTPTLGWGSYCYGFLESSRVTEYVGTDVIPSVCKKTQQFANKYYPNKTTSIYCVPSEELYKLPEFQKKYVGYFDVVFLSPPYYELEKYDGAKQSINKYKTYESWLTKYWQETIKLCFRVLKNGGKICYIVSNYEGNDRLVDDLNGITIKYFKLISDQPMYNKTVNVNNNQHRNEERIITFTKK